MRTGLLIITIFLEATLGGIYQRGVALDQLPGSGEVISIPEGSTPRVVIVGATIEGIPVELPVDVTDSGDHLDVECQLRAEWILDSNDSLVAQDIDRTDLDTFDWFHSWEGHFKAAINVGKMDPLWDYGYHSCLPGEKLEAPETGSYPLAPHAYVHVTDYHGGYLVAMSLAFLRHGQPGSDYYWVVAGYAHPGVHTDHTGAKVNARPGDVVFLPFVVWVGDTRYMCPVPVSIVEHVSEDVVVASQSRPLVDAADLSALSAYMNEPLRWGLTTEDPPEDPNFMFDFNLSGEGTAINAGDLSAYAAAIGDSCESAPSKPGSDAERLAILEWFGIAATGRTTVIGSNGKTGPEYDIVDWDKNRRACADPYGYRSNIASGEPISWSHAKGLFR
jgi:hypothetical protein